jgi:RNA polymerase sigma-70 factor, ECF subfamily
MQASPPAPSYRVSPEEEAALLYAENAAGMLRFALATAGSREAAQDALQEAFLRFFIERTAGRQIHAPKAWLYAVVRNYLLDEMRSSGSRLKVDLDRLWDCADPRDDPESDYSRAELLSQLLRRELTPRELECVRLRAEGLSYEQIAQALGLRSGTVGALLARAHKKLRGRAFAISETATEDSIRFGQPKEKACAP